MKRMYSFVQYVLVKIAGVHHWHAVRRVLARLIPAAPFQGG
jgi:hypothetical protein